MFLSVIIPVYNEADNILKVVNELVKNINSIPTVVKFEIIVCDDHSSDKTFDLIKNLGDVKIKAIRLSRRGGSHTALRAGLTLAKGDPVLCISGDGQDNPVVLEKMINKINEGNNVVWAVRTNRDEPFYQKLFAQAFYKILFKILGGNINKINFANADFYILSKKVVDAINQCHERNSSLFGLIIWMGFKQNYVEYERRPRFSGQTKWNFQSKLGFAKDWIIAFSGLPLRFITYIGIIYATIGLLYAAFIFSSSILGYTVSGWSENILILLISDGIKMIMLGIIGEYLWRTLDETRKRPLFFIEEETEKK